MIRKVEPNQRTNTQRRRERATLLLLLLIVLLLGLCGVGMVAEVALRAVKPIAEIYPHSLLARLSADYRPWDSAAIPLPPLDPRVAVAAERDRSENLGAPGIV